MPIRLILICLMMFIFSCATSKNNEVDNSRKPAMANASYEIAEFRKLFRTGDVLHAPLAKNVSDFIYLAEQDLQSNKSAKLCVSYFFDSKGQVGKLAKYILEYLTNEWEYSVANPDKVSPFFSDKIYDVISDKRCPGFKNFSPEQKILFWTYVMQNLAFKESSCNPKATNNNPNVPNGPAVGLFQLELRKSLRDWRGAECAVATEAIRGEEANTKCSLKILKSQLNKTSHHYGKYPKADKTLTPISYWHGFNAKSTNEVWAWLDKRTKTMCSALAGLQND